MVEENQERRVSGVLQTPVRQSDNKGVIGKIAIIGAKGMLGSALIAEFAAEDPARFDLPEVDITKPDSVRRMLDAVRPTIVLNAAAYTDVDGCEDHEADAYAVNATGVKNLAAWCKGAGALLVHYSTDYVFDGKKQEGYAEDDPTGPTNAYGRTKLAGEKFLSASGACYLLVRTSWLYGPMGKNFVDTIIKRAAEVPELRVVNDQHGCPTYTVDLAKHTRLLMESQKTGIHHATNEGSTTWFDFAYAIITTARLSIPVLPMSSTALVRKAQRPMYSVLRNTKDAHLRPWQEALAQYRLEHVDGLYRSVG